MTETKLNTWKVYQRSAKSNGKPFPYQHDEIIWYWLTPVGLWSLEETKAREYANYRDASHDARIYGGNAGKFRAKETA